MFNQEVKVLLASISQLMKGVLKQTIEQTVIGRIFSRRIISGRTAKVMDYITALLKKHANADVIEYRALP